MPQYQWTTQEFIYALEHMRLSSTNHKVLQAFLNAPEYTLTAHSLAERASLPGGWTAANLRIGELARQFRPFLGELENMGDGAPHWWRYLSTGRWKDGRFYWTLRPELVEALGSKDC